jgi:hypothetical protein
MDNLNRYKIKVKFHLTSSSFITFVITLLNITKSLIFIFYFYFVKISKIPLLFLGKNCNDLGNGHDLTKFAKIPRL